MPAVIWPERVRLPWLVANVAVPTVCGEGLSVVVPSTVPSRFMSPTEEACTLLEKLVTPLSERSPPLERVSAGPLSWALAVVFRSPVEVMFTPTPAAVVPRSGKCRRSSE